MISHITASSWNTNPVHPLHDLFFAARDSFHVTKAHYYKIKVQLNYEAVWNTQYQDTDSYLQSKYVLCTKIVFKSIQCKLDEILQ